MQPSTFEGQAVGEECVIVHNINPTIPIGEITTIFNRYGDVQDIKNIGDNRRMVEFFDVRNAETAFL